MTAIASRQVAASEVLAYADVLAAAAGTTLAEAGRLIPGTPSWCAASDDGPAKLLALIAAACREAITNEGRQENAAQASKAVAAAEDWPAIATEYQQLARFRESRPWARRQGVTA